MFDDSCAFFTASIAGFHLLFIDVKIILRFSFILLYDDKATLLLSFILIYDDKAS